MEEILTQFLNSGPVGIIAAAVVYLVIALQRNSTKKTRDENQELMRYNNWLSLEEAIDCGIIDGIITSRASLEKELNDEK